MIPKKYTSFKEIDNDLKILKLQREIDMENLKMNFSLTKQSLQPAHLLGGFGGLVKSFLISLFAKKVFNKFSK
ncbi:hypothetical protein SAMN05421636_101533 [Pricia antarctica]|uniref:Glutaminyl-tRNA synthetase n=1 Tax=Pricia antarctica TaxID=641691 RepID=A0A1G6X4P4_9FLAO|nr:DUF6327 family protein [Pricia antarctica]SDD73150.1 hypothetical protein SAMN05421636_101533 [Pricia antarctica]